MNVLRSRWSVTCAATSLGCLLLCPAPAHAQVFVEVGGGWNFVPTLPTGPTYSSGSNVRASVGWRVASNFRWRFDAFTSHFESQDNEPQPCPTFGCPASAYLHSETVSGVIANGIVEVDPRGIFYLIGGAGFYDVNGVNDPVTEWHLGFSAGAGIAVPVAPHLRVFAEARWHDLLGTLANGPSNLFPVTVGLRF